MWRRRADSFEGRWYDVARGQTFYESFEKLTVDEGPLMSLRADLSYLERIVTKADAYKDLETDIMLCRFIWLTDSVLPGIQVNLRGACTKH